MFYSIDELLRVIGLWSHLVHNSENKQMIALGQPLYIVNFFTDKQQYVPIIAFDAVDPNVMIGDNDDINAGFGSGLGDLGVIPGTIRIGGVYVRVGDDFVQVNELPTGCDRSYCTQTGTPWQAAGAPTCPRPVSACGR